MIFPSSNLLATDLDESCGIRPNLTMAPKSRHRWNHAQSGNQKIAALVPQSVSAHSHLAGDDEVSTSSIGTEEDKGVFCCPRRPEDRLYENVILGHLPDLVLTSSSASTDDSISSLESSGSAAKSSKGKLVSNSTVLCSTRTIFKTYWDSTKSEHCCGQLVPRMSNTVTQVARPAEYNGTRHFTDCSKHDAATLSYESQLEQHEATSPPVKKTIREETESMGKRRSIFGGLYTHSSTPVLSSCESPFVSSAYIRKASSTSALVPSIKTNSRSCLQGAQSYFSPSNESRKPRAVSISSKTFCNRIGGECRPATPQSVSFNPNVYVLEFNTPKESYANDGWSKRFA